MHMSQSVIEGRETFFLPQRRRRQYPTLRDLLRIVQKTAFIVMDDWFKPAVARKGKTRVSPLATKSFGSYTRKKKKKKKKQKEKKKKWGAVNSSQLN